MKIKSKTKASKAPKKISKQTKEQEDREVYLSNRKDMEEQFKFFCKEVQLEKPSTPGEIAGMNFQQFSLASLFRLINDQEEYIDYSEKFKPKYVNIDEEKVILDDMIKKAKKIFGKEYDSLYKLYNY